MDKEKINEKDLNNASGGYQAFIEENKFTGKALYLTQNELEALKKSGFVTEEKSNPMIKSEKFQEAQEYLIKHGFKGMTHVSNNENTAVSINLIK